MIIILGLVILVAALIVGVAGILGNGGSAHAVAHFSVLGYHVGGSAGTVFLSGIVVGAAGLLGLSILLAGVRRTSRRSTAARRGLRRSRRETAAASQERDDLIEQRDAERAKDASNLSTVTALRHASPGPAGGRWSTLRDLRRRLAPEHTAAWTDSSASRAAGDVPASSLEPEVTANSPGVHPAADDPGSSTSQALDAHASASAPAE